MSSNVVFTFLRLTTSFFAIEITIMTTDALEAPWMNVLLTQLQARDAKERNGYDVVFSNCRLPLCTQITPSSRQDASLRDNFFKLDIAHSQLKRENKLLERENQRFSIQSESM